MKFQLNTKKKKKKENPQLKGKLRAQSNYDHAYFALDRSGSMFGWKSEEAEHIPKTFSSEQFTDGKTFKCFSWDKIYNEDMEKLQFIHKCIKAIIQFL